MCDFNPLPRKEGDRPLCVRVVASGNFNPLPRKEGDCSHLFAFVQQKISIHSLVKRETAICDSYSSLLWDISIHSLVKRETWQSGFQLCRFSISIHSLVKRETKK